MYVCVYVCEQSSHSCSHFKAKGRSVFKTNDHLSVCTLVLVLCSLQSLGLHLILESTAAIPELIHESFLSVLVF